MIINIKDVVTLNDGNEYVVVSKTIYDNKTYYYLVDINDNTNLMFCKEDSDPSKKELIEVEDKELVKTLLPLFVNELGDIEDYLNN